MLQRPFFNKSVTYQLSAGAGPVHSKWHEPAQGYTSTTLFLRDANILPHGEWVKDHALWFLRVSQTFFCVQSADWTGYHCQCHCLKHSVAYVVTMSQTLSMLCRHYPKGLASLCCVVSANGCPVEDAPPSTLRHRPQRFFEFLHQKPRDTAGV